MPAPHLLSRSQAPRSTFAGMTAPASTREDVIERLQNAEAEIRRLGTTEALSPYIGPHILAEAEDLLPAA